MELPIPYDEALEEWDRFEKYLVQARYSVRDPKNGKPLEEDFRQGLVRVSSQFAHPGVAKALAHGQIITATPFLMNGGNKYTSQPGLLLLLSLGRCGRFHRGHFRHGTGPGHHLPACRRRRHRRQQPAAPGHHRRQRPGHRLRAGLLRQGLLAPLGPDQPGRQTARRPDDPGQLRHQGHQGLHHLQGRQPRQVHRLQRLGQRHRREVLGGRGTACQLISEYIWKSGDPGSALHPEEPGEHPGAGQAQPGLLQPLRRVSFHQGHRLQPAHRQPAQVSGRQPGKVPGQRLRSGAAGRHRRQRDPRHGRFPAGASGSRKTPSSSAPSASASPVCTMP